MRQNNSSSLLKKIVFCQLGALLGLQPVVPTVQAEVSDSLITDFATSPVNLSGDTVSPHVLINTSNDHQFYFKVYNDYSDLDSDGELETTYKHSIDYYGYYDSYTCYDYKRPGFDVNGSGSEDSDDTIFVPAALTTDKYCEGGSSGLWSGNFLNWVTMARIDAIRKILYGGLRRLDSSTNTVLERTYLPHDAHSWAKHYEGDDLKKLTPFIQGTDFVLGDTDPKKNGITFANTTDVADQDMRSQHVPDQVDGSFKWKNPDPPLMKVVPGNYSLWASNERWQCTWASDSPVGDNRSATNANDPTLSGINAYSSSPGYDDGIGEKEYIIRIQACAPGLENLDSCKQYPDGNYKPIGLFQRWGDDDTLLFGMMTGTYQKHATGGELVSDIQSMKSEVNTDSDGTFKLTVDTIGGPIQYNKAVPSLISRWSLYRIYGYNHKEGYYNGSQDDDCPWALSALSDTTADGKCTNWGNPFSEIYLQSLRYMAGLGIDGTFRANDSGYIRGIDTPENWQNPLYECNACARLNILNFNSSSSSYDYDDIDSNSNGPHTIFYDVTEKEGIQLPGDTSNHSIKMTDFVGKGEGIHGNKFFVGETDVTDSGGQTDDQLCTEKTITSLGEAGGICPEAPRLKGAYTIAGLAYYAHVYDIRPGGENSQVDCGTNTGTTQGQRNLPGEQRVDTYGVSMATAVPTIEIPGLDGTTAVAILPACRNTSLSPNGNCAIVDFKVVSQNLSAGTGKFYVNWEDSEQGGDYDQDMWGIIEYQINSDSITITTDTIAKSTPYGMGFGYVVSGTTDDGFHAHSGINGYTSTETGDVDSDCSNGCNVENGATTATYSLGSSSAGLLKDPLWYAAKWGGFIDRDGNKLPFNDKNGNGALDSGEETPGEWDSKINETGADGSDGIPDNYFYATNPQALEDALNRVFLTILERTSSGTAAAVVANNLKGEGALYQAYYEPKRTDLQNNEVTWIGSLISTWIDSAGFMREDNSGCYDPDETDVDTTKKCNGGDNSGTACTSHAGCPGKNYILDDYEVDPVIETYFDEVDEKTMVRRWTSSDPDIFVPVTATKIDLDEIRSLWNAREQLSAITDDISIQRMLSTKANNGRHITTWIDTDLDGVVDDGEEKDFINALAVDNYGYFDIASSLEAENIIDYIRGEEVTGFRSRILDYRNDGVPEVQRLGDIINSTPSVVGPPQEAFNLLYGDESYAPFLTKYMDRRNVVYLGANDGMLHAFNSGFYIPSQPSYNIGRPKPRRTWTDPGIPEFYAITDTQYRTEHPLGSELWAYVPKNLLPHLKWLTSPEYPHLYYVDGTPRVFDAKIFTEETSCGDVASETCIHPNGWGTVLVVGMRLGGGPVTVDTEANGLGGSNVDDDVTMSSAYIIFDVTNPEVPVLMGEVPLPDQSYALVYPTIFSVKDRDPNLDNNMWYLAFGNGPDDLLKVVSSSTAKLYLLDLVTLADTGQVSILTKDTNVANSFLGNPSSVDWDLNYKSDGLYFGLAGWETKTIGSDTFTYANGQMWMLNGNESDNPVDWDPLQAIINMKQPLTSTVAFGLDNNADRWVYFGTGRFLSSDDRDTSNTLNKTSVQTQSLYGVKISTIFNEATTIPALTLTYTEDDSDNVFDDRVSDPKILDVTNIKVYEDYTVSGAPTDITTLSELDTEIEDNRWGWVLDYPPIQGVEGIAPATRSVSAPALLGGILFNSVYQPSTDPCTGEGFSRLYGLYYKTGTAYPLTLGADSTDTNSNGVSRAVAYIDLGVGYATSPSIHSGSAGEGNEVSVFTQLSTGTILRKEAELDESVRSGRQSWRPIAK